MLDGGSVAGFEGCVEVLPHFQGEVNLYSGSKSVSSIFKVNYCSPNCFFILIFEVLSLLLGY